MADGWKSWAERLAASSGFPRVALAWQRPSAVILAYHNIVPRGEVAKGELSLHVNQAEFADQLDVLLETHEVVPLGAVDAEAPEGRPRARAVITFDDAYAGALNAGLEELEKRDLPCTVMVAPGILGRPTWWDQLAAESQGRLSDRVRDRCIWKLRGMAPQILEWARREGMGVGEFPPHAVPVDEYGLLECTRRKGVMLGVHSWSHANLAVLSTEALDDELRSSREWLRERAPKYADWLAFPYGAYSDGAVSAASGVFQGGLRVDGGLAVRKGRRQGKPGATPRVNVPRGLSIQGFVLRLSGLV